MLFNALNLKIPRLGKNRHGVYYVRHSAPDALGTRKVVQHSLATKDPNTAKYLALKFNLTLAEGLSVTDFFNFRAYEIVDPVLGKIIANGPKDHARAMEARTLIHQQWMEQNAAEIRLASLRATGSVVAPNVPGPDPVLSIARKPLQEAFDAHLGEEIRSNLADQTIGEKRILFKDFLDCFGNVDLNDLKHKNITDHWRDAEFTRPNKKHPGQALSLARLEKRRGYLSKFFEWAKMGGIYLHENPVKQKMGSKKQIRDATQSYEEFTSEDLAKLFRANYVFEMDKPDWYWLPLLSLCSGARVGEVANLEVNNFEVVDGIKCFKITEGKTRASKRRVPIHSILLDLGIWEYVQFLKSKGFTHFVPHRPSTIRSKSIVLHWGKWIDKSGITAKGKVFHSFRSMVVTDLYSADANSAQVRDSVGHESVEMSGAHGTYVRGIPLQNIQKTLEKLVFPTVDKQVLKLVDPTFSTFFSKMDGPDDVEKKLAKAASLAKHQAAREARLLRLSKTRTPPGNALSK